MFTNDLPIISKSQDLLGRADFASDFARSIAQYHQSESFTIGLCGSWGSGKTSIINMILESLETMIVDQKTIVLKFNPWLFSDQKQLVDQFFRQLSEKIKKDIYNGKKSVLADILIWYSEAISWFTSVPTVGMAAKFTSSISQVIGSKLNDRVSKHESNILKIKDKIVEELRKENLKIVVVIDDLDRLNNEEIRTVFQLIKSMADFPQTIYLAAFDREIVITALEDVQKGNGERYLEKIIQFPFDLPPIKKDKVNQIFFDKLNKILSVNPNLSIEQEEWSSIFWKGINPYLVNVRDVIRFQNVFVMKLNPLSENINFLDLVAVTTIQVFENRIYKQISSLSQDLCGTFSNLGTDDYERKKLKETIDNLVSKEDTCNSTAVKELLICLFNKVSVAYSAWNINQYNEIISYTKNRICNRKCFERYFSLNPDDGGISYDKIKNSLDNFNILLFKNDMNSLDSNEKVKTYFDALIAYFKEEKVPHFDAYSFLYELYISWPKLNFEDPEFFSYPLVWKRNDIVDLVIQQKNEDKERKEIVTKLFNDSSLPLYVLIDQLIVWEREYGRFSEKITDLAKIKTFPIEDLEDLEKILIGKISTADNLIEKEQFSHILYFWENIDNSGAMEYMKKVQGNVDICELAVCLTSFVYHGKGAGATVFKTWDVDIEKLKKYFNIDDLYQKMNDFSKNEEFMNLNNYIKEDIIALLIKFEKNSEVHNENILIKEIDERMKLQNEVL